MLLLINSLTHMCVDGLCASCLFGKITAESAFFFIITYDTLAFSTQAVVGLLADRLKNQSVFSAVSVIMIILGWVIPLHPAVRVTLIGLGNSGFHVSGGIMTLKNSRDKAYPLGVFVAPGAIGLSVGTLFPDSGIFFAIGLGLAAFIYLFAGKKLESVLSADNSVEIRRTDMKGALLLTLAVAVRAIGGSAVSFTWKSGNISVLLITLFVFLGKFAGGFICDRAGIKKTAYISIITASVLTAFLSSYMIPSIAGQFLLNLTMPITLWLIYKCIPDSPGFAFGLAAAALWPGTITGKLLKLTGPALWVFILIAFGFGLYAILHVYSQIDLSKED